MRRLLAKFDPCSPVPGVQRVAESPVRELQVARAISSHSSLWFDVALPLETIPPLSTRSDMSTAGAPESFFVEAFAVEEAIEPKPERARKPEHDERKHQAEHDQRGG